MGSKFKTPPKTMTDKTEPSAIATCEKISPSNQEMRIPALELLITAATNLKKRPQPPDVLGWVAEARKLAEVERKLMEAQTKALGAGGHEGAPSRGVADRRRAASGPDLTR